MYKLSRRQNLIPFAVLLVLGLAACMFVPQHFTDNVFEIPAFALFPAEVALVMMLSVLFFENATPSELLRLSFMMLALCMLTGGIGNIFGKTSQSLPDQTLLLNWVQLVCMNISGLVATVALYQTRTNTTTVKSKPTPVREVAVKAPDVPASLTEPLRVIDEKDGESVQDILAKLDVNRINSLESSLKKNEPGGSVSLETLFADESQAALPAPQPEPPQIHSSLQSLDGLLALDSPEPEFMPAAEIPPPPPPLPEPPKLESKPEPQAPVAAPASTEPKLFDDVSGDLEDIFADLASTAANDDVTPEKLAEIKSHTPPPEPPAPVEPKADKLMDVSDSEIDDIFGNIIAEDAPPPPVAPSAPTPLATSPATAGSGAREVKEFGRLSAAATTNKSDLANQGTLKTIGQMLLDTQAVENIIKHSEARTEGPGTARVVSVSRGADIQAMLNDVASIPGITGSLVIGKDGLLIGATDSLGMMRDVYGVLALGIHSTTNLGTKKMDMGDLRQSILRCGNKITIMTEIGIGVLAAFGDSWESVQIDSAMDQIAKCVQASQASGGASLPTESLGGGLLSEPQPALDAVYKSPAKAEPVMPAPPQHEVVASITEMKGGLLNVDDSDLGDLFDNVLANPSVQNDAIGKAAAPSSDLEAELDKAFSPNADMSDLFDDLMEMADTPVEQSIDFTPAAQTPNSAEAAPAAEEKAQPAQVQQVKEFGRLSASAAAQSESTGAIKAIGRQLIDVQAVENIIKSGEKRERMGAGMTTARVISAARGEGIKALLTKIDGHKGVVGSLIVGNDGLVIASTLTGGLDKDLLGALCSAMHSHTDLAGKKLNMGKMRQIIFHAAGKMTVLTAVAVGVLAVFVDNHEVADIDSLLTAIEGTVRG